MNNFQESKLLLQKLNDTNESIPAEQNRRLSDLKDKLLQSGYNVDDIFEACDFHNENKIWTLQSLMNIIANQGYTETDISNYCKRKKCELWIKLISSDWFSIFLTYLNLNDIVRLDSAFTNHEEVYALNSK